MTIETNTLITQLRARVAELEAERETLRDKFAMAALNGLLSGNWDETGEELTPQTVYVLAHAMMAERSKR